MGPYVTRALRWSAMGGIVVLGALIWREAEENSFIEACVFGLIALGVAGVGLGEWNASASGAPLVATDIRPEARASAVEQRLTVNLTAIVGLLKAYLRANSSYSETLVRVNKDLPRLDKPDEIRAMVVSLIEENEAIRSRIDDLARNLDESVAKIDDLRFNLADANARALRDPLTALGNRRFFDQRLGEAMQEAETSRRLSLVLCDLDRFKTVNDKFGHPVGDMVLKLFSEILSASARRGETVARLGGEEFAIIASDADASDAAEIADQIRSQLESKKWVVESTGSPLGVVTASFGIAQLAPSESAADLLKRADKALYRAKAEGRNRVIIAG